MNIRSVYRITLMLSVALLFSVAAKAQWAKDGYHYYSMQAGAIVEQDIRDAASTKTIVTTAMLTPAGKAALQPRRFAFSEDNTKVLLNTNTKQVWRYDTRGDYWVLDMKTNKLRQLGKGRPESSLMFAKFNPDGSKVAYVSEHNLYVEDVASGAIKALTTNGSKHLINGTFDWVYEEEFDCRDGFRWSPNGTTIAYWQIDARKTKNYLMLNMTDSVYSRVVPVEYPVAGEDPSACKIGVVDIATAKTRWMNVPGSAVQNYIPRMAWAGNPNELIMQQLNRAQTVSKILVANISNGTVRAINTEEDKAWIDVKGDDEWIWLDKGRKFVWLSEKDGWRHIYTIDRDGKEQLITKADYDVVSVESIDEAGGLIYFIASPDNATQRYLYKVAVTGGKPERVSPADQPGTHSYNVTPNGKIAYHTFSNSYTAPAREIVSLPEHKHLSGSDIKLNEAGKAKGPEFFKVKTQDGIEMDGWMVKPTNFDPAKKYPVVFMVYGEPASSTAPDSYGVGRNAQYVGSMANDGYIYMSLDNRGAPVPKGREWRKAIYKNIGIVNVRDQAMAAKEILKWNFLDTSRVAVWGWSGGGSSTLNLMFQYPEIYKTGIAVAAVGWQLTYDNIYQERYMGVPTDEAGKAPFIKGSPVTYAKNLKGNLLYIHGTGDDNVHYNNAEMLINELIKYNKQFQVMPYPNRTHGIYEGAGTSLHLRTLFTNYLKQYCPPGGR
ncbi:S9 family peptidase [Mucilaginibacter myungsuensis]|uniref:S9 family peptidase n=1 Tax=Mucilaginibacter myungsuensis TaxID=649104 RepID=A0A929KYL4_9SPHI|nr:S9 family peptidase [Mucilaginibacter myungsuensis]MBE9664074.1 S9 family peptidase [Mucilaginibacter myungsuensis]MDN3601252.1 S9 family peptidase [Mucilaginibacter myungsuensis]